MKTLPTSSRIIDDIFVSDTGHAWGAATNPELEDSKNHTRYSPAQPPMEPVAWRVIITGTGFARWIHYYDFGAAHCPLNDDGTWKENHPHHWKVNDSPSKKLKVESVDKLYAVVRSEKANENF